jgi:hypothetical protein
MERNRRHWVGRTGEVVRLEPSLYEPGWVWHGARTAAVTWLWAVENTLAELAHGHGFEQHCQDMEEPLTT